MPAPRTTDPQRCGRCGRALAPDERTCEGCALRAVTQGARGRRWGRAPLVFGIVAATVEMAVVLWLLFGR
jgi:predicted nucleic acid-binding Zn ribbon protein